MISDQMWVGCFTKGVKQSREGRKATGNLVAAMWQVSLLSILAALLLLGFQGYITAGHQPAAVTAAVITT